MDHADDHKMSLQGFDPLAENAAGDGYEQTVFTEATKRIVQNVLKSYTGYFDVFSELIQNSLDAVDAATAADPTHRGKLTIDIDIPGQRVSVMDNGTGMTAQQLRYCFRPSVSFKSRRESRGHKGVGATFLAYGFQNIQISTKTIAGQVAVQLSNGRAWAEDQLNTTRRPKLEVVKFQAAELQAERSGTKVEIHLGDSRPDLTWWSAQNASQWLQILCMRTPLGGVYLQGRTPPQIEVTVRVRNSANEQSEESRSRAEYLWPHEFTDVLPKVQSVDNLQKEIVKVSGDRTKLPSELKNLSAIYDVWSPDDLLDEDSLFWDKTFDEEDKRLIRLHSVAAYGCFVSSAKVWTRYQEEVLRVRRSPTLMRGGMQIASDFMVQGDLSVIPLTSTIGYQANTHVVIHFRDGNPDMGRKVFQPEIKALSEKISRQIVNIFKRYLIYMREDTGISPVRDSSEIWTWLRGLEDRRKDKPLEFVSGNLSIAYVSMPSCEQDVIAIFHELVGMNILKGLRFLGTTGVGKYDSAYLTYYPISDFTYSSNNMLGVSEPSINVKESRPFVLEYKFNFDALISDVEKEEKHIQDLHLVVCWEIGSDYRDRYRLVSLLLGDEGASRQVYGSTHAFYQEREKRFEIICLSDLFDFLRSPDLVRARHAQTYSG